MTVTVQSALTEVQDAARRLREITRELVLIAVEDQPRNCEVHLVTVVHDRALDVAAEAEQADAVVARGQLLSAGQRRPTLSRAVADCQEHVTLMGVGLIRELGAPELQADLSALGRERGREVKAWVKEVSRCIQACQIALWTDVQPALLAYWRELADITDQSPMCPATDADLA